MEFLGHLGIDFKLLLAQAINFALLLWLLDKLLYRPIIHRLEEDEKKLKEAEEAQRELAAEKEKVFHQEKELILQSQKQAEKIIENAKEIARAIRDKAAKERERALRRQQFELEKKLALAEKQNRTERGDSFRKKFAIELKARLEKAFSQSEQKRLAAAFFDLLLAKLDKIKDDEFASSSSTAILYSTPSLGEQRKKELEQALTKKLGREIEVDFRQDNSLISGFRLEAGGVMVASNLADKIKEAVSDE